jgi:hypothetical protein
MKTIDDNKPVDARKDVTNYINDVEYHVTDRKMTGAELKALASIPAGDHLYREVPGPRPDKLIADDEVVHLKENDHFYSIPPGTKGEGILPLVQTQIDRVRRDYPELVVNHQPDGSFEMEIPCFELPQGWSKPQTRVMMLVPVGYPDNRPQGPFVDQDLQLASGQNAGGESDPQPINGRTWRSFCWSPNREDLHRDGLWKSLKFQLSRLEDPS